MTKQILQSIKDKVLRMPEYSQGAHKIWVRLKDGTEHSSVFIAWGTEIFKVGKSTKIPFNAENIIEVKNDL